MQKKIEVGTNFLNHDSSVSFLDLENEEIFAIQNENISRFKHDNISVSTGLKKLKKQLNIPNEKVLWSMSYCYENEDTFKNCSYIWKRNLILHDLRKIFNLTEVKQQTKLLSKGLKNLFMKLLLKLPQSLSLLYILSVYYLFYKNKKNSLKKNINDYLLFDLKKYLKGDKFKLFFWDHHTCHNFSAYCLSPFDNCLGISLDYLGDQHFSKVIEFRKDRYSIKVASRAARDKYNNVVSIGSIYSYCTSFLGFVPNSDEGKVEALAAYGNKKNYLYDKLISSTSVNDNYEIIIQNEVLEYLKNNLEKINNDIGKENIASAVQGYLEDFVVDYIKKISIKFNNKNIVLSGGTFANVKLNMNIFEKSGIENMYVVPAMNDAGAGLGSLFLKLIESKKMKYDHFKKAKYSMPYWGPKFDRNEIIHQLRDFSKEINISELKKSEWISLLAKKICSGQIGGLFQGKMEFGPRALGNRSILGDATSSETKKIINKIIKGRPNFQPFCPAILEEDRNELFERSYSNKHMTCAFKMKKEYLHMLPSAVHIDGTARPQFVEKEDNENLFLLLKEIKKKKKFGVVVNTSFNKHGRTMVMEPKDAIRDFLDTKMDFIFFEDILVTKKK